MTVVLPEWVYRIIDGLGEYEDLHPSPRDGGECLANLWELAPKEVQREAAVFMAGVRAVENRDKGAAT